MLLVLFIFVLFFFFHSYFVAATAIGFIFIGIYGRRGSWAGGQVDKHHPQLGQLRYAPFIFISFYFISYTVSFSFPFI